MKKELRKFIKELEEGWDNGIKYIENNYQDKQLLEYVNNYYDGYNYCIDNDIDGGKCFEMRSQAIKDIIDYLSLN